MSTRRVSTVHFVSSPPLILCPEDSRPRGLRAVVGDTAPEAVSRTGPRSSEHLGRPSVVFLGLWLQVPLRVLTEVHRHGTLHPTKSRVYPKESPGLFVNPFQLSFPVQRGGFRDSPPENKKTPFLGSQI